MATLEKDNLFSLNKNEDVEKGVDNKESEKVSNNSEVENSEEKLTLGNLLRKEREEQNLDRTDIAQKLRIKEMYLQALEEGNYTIFPGLVYGAGFLRSYALFLGLNEKEALELFKEETSHLVQEPVEMPIPANRNVMPSKRLLFSLLILGVLFYLLWYVFSPSKTHEITLDSFLNSTVSQMAEPIQEAPINSDELLAEVVPTEPAPLNPLLVSGETAQSDSLGLSGTGENALLGASDQSNVVSPSTPESEIKLEELQTEKPLPPITGKTYGLEKPAILSFVANNRVWVEIRENGKVIFNRILLKGDGYNLPENSQKMLMHTGNAAALSVYVNGEYWDVLDRKATVKKGISLDPALYKSQH